MVHGVLRTCNKKLTFQKGQNIIVEGTFPKCRMKTELEEAQGNMGRSQAIAGTLKSFVPGYLRVVKKGSLLI